MKQSLMVILKTYFSSYLSNRRLIIHHDFALSDMFMAKSDLPQGSQGLLVDFSIILITRLLKHFTLQNQNAHGSLLHYQTAAAIKTLSIQFFQFYLNDLNKLLLIQYNNDVCCFSSIYNKAQQWAWAVNGCNLLPIPRYPVPTGN